MRLLSKGKQGSTNTNRKRGRDSLQSDLVANDLSVEQEATSPSLQFISAEEVRRALGEERAWAATSSYSPQRAASRKQGEGDIHAHSPGQTAGTLPPLPDPWGSTHSATGEQESHSPRPPPSVPPGDGAGGHFRAPFFSSPSASLQGGLRCRLSCQVQQVPGDTLLPLPRLRPGLGDVPIGWACLLLAKTPLAIGHGSPAVREGSS